MRAVFVQHVDLKERLDGFAGPAPPLAFDQPGQVLGRAHREPWDVLHLFGRVAVDLGRGGRRVNHARVADAVVDEERDGDVGGGQGIHERTLEPSQELLVPFVVHLFVIHLPQAQIWPTPAAKIHLVFVLLSGARFAFGARPRDFRFDGDST